MNRREFGGLAAGALAMGMPLRVLADETCQSPYMPKITGHEEYVYVWTLGVEGMGDEQDKLVTIDVRPDSATRGQVINSLSVGGRNEAHHGGFSSDRRYFWCGGLDTSRIFIFGRAFRPVETQPAQNHRYLCQRFRWLCRPAYLLRPSRTGDDHRPVQ